MPPQHLLFLELDEMMSLQILTKMLVEAKGEVPPVLEKLPLSPLFVEHLASIERKLSQKIEEVSD
ncbi:hypothetical protein GCM10018783_73840 [Streptomyces griseosporeus]|nr:hypothetical protein GCM10018783_73840 [Streptomyces griseosporeus]